MAHEIIVFVTCPQSSADDIAKTLIEEKLVACVNIVPAVKSVFQWQGKVCTENESLLIIKSNRQKWETLEIRVKELHTYDIPEIICFEIQAGHKPYLNWLNSCVNSDKK